MNPQNVNKFSDLLNDVIPFVQDWNKIVKNLDRITLFIDKIDGKSVVEKF